MPIKTAPNTAYPMTAPKPHSGRLACVAFKPLYATRISANPAASSTDASQKLRRRKLPSTRRIATTSEAVATTICAQIGARQALSNPRIKTHPHREFAHEASF